MRRNRKQDGVRLFYYVFFWFLTFGFDFLMFLIYFFIFLAFSLSHSQKFGSLVEPKQQPLQEALSRLILSTCRVYRVVDVSTGMSLLGLAQRAAAIAQDSWIPGRIKLHCCIYHLQSFPSDRLNESLLCDEDLPHLNTRTLLTLSISSPQPLAYVEIPHPQIPHSVCRAMGHGCPEMPIPARVTGYRGDERLTPGILTAPSSPPWQSSHLQNILEAH